MARKSDILNAVKMTAEFLGDSERPQSLSLRVDSLSTLTRTPKGVQHTRKSLRAFAKALLTERQNFGAGLYILKDVNVKALKDAQLGELLGATNPNGVSKYYTTIRRMTYSNILATAIAEQETSEPKVVAKATKVVVKTTKKPRKSKTSKKAKPSNKQAEKELFDKDGALKPFQPKAEKKSTHKKAVSKETVTLTAVVNGMNLSTTMLKHLWENTNRQHWVNQCIEVGVPSTGSKKEMAIRVGVLNSLLA